MMDTNVKGLIYVSRTVLPFMVEQNSGHVLNIGSTAGAGAYAKGAVYCASKAAVVQYCESLRVELYGTGVKVTTILPGFIDTPMTQANPYKMPFLMPVEDFAAQAVRAINQQKSYKVIPWQMGVLAKIMRLIPNGLYDKILSRRKRKPRAGEK